MKIEIWKNERIADLDEFSRSIGNTPMQAFLCAASVLCGDEEEILGFAAVQASCHAAGSYVNPKIRKQGWSYRLREALELSLKTEQVHRYFAIPGNDFERMLFKKYGPVTEKLVQIKEL